MADIALGSVKNIIKAGIAIKKAVQTARQNRVECQEIEELVALAILLLQLQNNKQVMMNPPAINAALAGLERTLYRALELVNDCQERNITLARRILGSSDMSKKLRRVKDDILQKMVLGTFATTVQVTMTLTNNIPYGGAHHLFAAAHPQDAGQVDVSYSGHFTTDDCGSGFNNGVRMAATGSEVCYAPSSRSREFNLSELENVSGGGGHRLVLRKEVIIRVQMTSSKSQSRAVKLMAAVSGVESVTLGGECKDLLLVIGVGVDSDKLTGRLRKKVGLADLVELRTVDYMKSTRSAALWARDDEDLPSMLNPPLPQHHSQHLCRHPFVMGEACCSSRNLHQPAWQRSSASSSDSDEPQLSPRPSAACAEGIKGKGKQILAGQQHQKMRPSHADARLDGQTPRGFMAESRRSMPPHQDSIELVDSMTMNPTIPVQHKKVGAIEHLPEASADYRPGQQVSAFYPVNDDRVPFLRIIYGVVFVFLFLFILSSYYY